MYYQLIIHGYIICFSRVIIQLEEVTNFGLDFGQSLIGNVKSRGELTRNRRMAELIDLLLAFLDPNVLKFVK